MSFRSAFFALTVITAGPATAQSYTTPTPYCGGRLVAELFNSQVTPGSQGRVDYSMRVHNTGPQALRFQVQVVGDMLNRPSVPFSIPMQQRLNVVLGYSLNAPGRQPLRGESLANAVRVSCI